MIKIFEGFRNFILRGNAVDLAVGVVIGAAFNGVVNALVKDFLTPIITFDLRKFNYTDLFNSVVSFLLTAVAVYFFVVVPMNKLGSLRKKGEAPAPVTKKCPQCLSEIPVAAQRCAHCAQPVQ